MVRGAPPRESVECVASIQEECDVRSRMQETCETYGSDVFRDGPACREPENVTREKEIQDFWKVPPLRVESGNPSATPRRVRPVGESGDFKRQSRIDAQVKGRAR